MTKVGKVWFVTGDEYMTLFATKMDAEKWARQMFPEEDFAKRYARIRYKDVEIME
jgi:hypothetical protein